jgi:hypothetical protein
MEQDLHQIFSTQKARLKKQAKKLYKLKKLNELNKFDELFQRT